MFIRIAVHDPLPMYRRGLTATLADAGFDSETPDNLLAWARVEEPRMILFTVTGPDDWTQLTQLCQARAGITVLAVLNETTVQSYVRALSAGAAAAMPRTASADEFRAVLAAAIAGQSIIPTTVLRALAQRPNVEASAAAAGEPTADEREWLRQLAHGSSVARLAEQAGYSERMMFRLLRDLYSKLRVANRTEALMRARDKGWI